MFCTQNYSIENKFQKINVNHPLFFFLFDVVRKEIGVIITTECKSLHNPLRYKERSILITEVQHEIEILTLSNRKKNVKLKIQFYSMYRLRIRLLSLVVIASEINFKYWNSLVDKYTYNERT